MAFAHSAGSGAPSLSSSSREPGQHLSSQAPMSSGTRNERAPLLVPASRSSDRRASDGGRGTRGRTMEAARYLQRAGSGRIMREESVRVRENAAEQLEETQSDWAYSRPVVVLDVIWNLAFVIVACIVLYLGRDEKTSGTPLRVWIVGHAVQCVLHMLFVWAEYKRRRRPVADSTVEDPQQTPPYTATSSSTTTNDNSSSSSRRRRAGSQEQERATESDYLQLAAGPSQTATTSGTAGVAATGDEGDLQRVITEEWSERTSLAKLLEYINTLFSVGWWMVGFYWVLSAGPNLSVVAPLLYWLCVIFLAFDVFFVLFCIALACIIGIAVCCCLPCIIAILYAITDQQNCATEAEINELPKYRFHRDTPPPSPPLVLSLSPSDAAAHPTSAGGTMVLVEDEEVTRQLAPEDAECCICLSLYEDDVELRELPCHHHFHVGCIDKWLRINATCPLCKYNIHHERNAER